MTVPILIHSITTCFDLHTELHWVTRANTLHVIIPLNGSCSEIETNIFWTFSHLTQPVRINWTQLFVSNHSRIRGSPSWRWLSAFTQFDFIVYYIELFNNTRMVFAEWCSGEVKMLMGYWKRECDRVHVHVVCACAYGWNALTRTHRFRVLFASAATRRISCCNRWTQSRLSVYEECTMRQRRHMLWCFCGISNFQFHNITLHCRLRDMWPGRVHYHIRPAYSCRQVTMWIDAWMCTNNLEIHWQLW